jgi:hypothetical protein
MKQKRFAVYVSQYHSPRRSREMWLGSGSWLYVDSTVSIFVSEGIVNDRGGASPAQDKKTSQA